MSGATSLNESYHEINSKRTQGWAEAVFVYSAWAALFVAAFWFARTHGNPVPFIDEWSHISILAGDEPLTPAWLWKPHGEHRIPLAKLVWATVIKLSGSFKVGVYLNVFLLGVLALAMVRTAQKLPGGLTYTDAIIPILLLHLGQGYNLQWWWQIMENLPSVILGLLIIAVVRGGPELSPKWALVAGVCLLLLPFSGPSGLPCLLAMSVWLGVWAVRSISSSDTPRRRYGVVVTVMAAAAVAFLGLYFLGLKKPPHMPKSPGLDATLRTAVQFLSVSVGPGANYVWKAKAAVIIAFLIASCLVLVISWFRWPAATYRITGLLFITAAVFPLALGLGWGRAYGGQTAGLSHWYAIFGVPALLAGYFAWRLYAPAAFGQFVRVAVFAGMCMMLALNLNWSREFFADHKQRMTAFVDDVNGGTILPELADRHVSFLFGAEHAGIFWEPALRQLHSAGYPIFRALNAPNLVEIPVTFSFKRTNNASWHDDVLTGAGRDPYVVFTLDEPQHIYAIRLIFSYESSRNPETCEFYWQSRGASDFVSGDRFRTWQQNTAQKPCSRTILVDEIIDEFRIDPADNPSVFRLERVAFLAKGAEKSIQGVFDTVNADYLAGWVWDPTRPNEPLKVDILDGRDIIATITADEFREDLRALGIGDGRHGFSLPTPAALKDGKPHSVAVRVTGTALNVPGSPKPYPGKTR